MRSLAQYVRVRGSMWRLLRMNLLQCRMSFLIRLGKPLWNPPWCWVFSNSPKKKWRNNARDQGLNGAHGYWGVTHLYDEGHVQRTDQKIQKYFVVHLSLQQFLYLSPKVPSHCRGFWHTLFGNAFLEHHWKIIWDMIGNLVPNVFRGRGNDKELNTLMLTTTVTDIVGRGGLWSKAELMKTSCCADKRAHKTYLKKMVTALLISLLAGFKGIFWPRCPR